MRQQNISSLNKQSREIGQSFDESLREDKRVKNLQIFWINNKTITSEKGNTFQATLKIRWSQERIKLYPLLVADMFEIC